MLGVLGGLFWMPGMPEILFILPALNEERGVGNVLDRIPSSELQRRGYHVKVWVLDGRSEDRTAEVAKEKGAKVLIQEGRGKGRAVSQAFDFIHSDFVIMLDADNTYNPRDVLPMMSLLENGHDVVMGSRLQGSMHEGAMTKRNRLGNVMLSSIASILFRRFVSDLCTGFWGFKGSALRKITVDARGFELEAQMFSRCAKSGLVIGEVPINYGCRNGDGTKLRSFSAGARILLTLLTERFGREREAVRGAEAAPALSAEAPAVSAVKMHPAMK